MALDFSPIAGIGKPRWSLGYKYMTGVGVETKSKTISAVNFVDAISKFTYDGAARPTNGMLANSGYTPQELRNFLQSLGTLTGFGNAVSDSETINATFTLGGV